MSADKGSVSTFLDLVKGQDEEAAQALWELYYEQMIRVARASLRCAALRGADEEDVALSAFDSFCRGAAQGRFPSLADRQGLRRMLAEITRCKAIDQVQHERRQKRGGGKVVSGLPSESSSTAPLAQLADSLPPPEVVAAAAEEFRRLLEALDDERLCRIALWRLEGYSNEEIAEKLAVNPRTIERKLQLIRDKWRPLLPFDVGDEL
jgi:RNA polymerase sigma factor (sigma-70 family)